MEDQAEPGSDLSFLPHDHRYGLQHGAGRIGARQEVQAIGQVRWQLSCRPLSTRLNRELYLYYSDQWPAQRQRVNAAGPGFQVNMHHAVRRTGVPGLSPLKGAALFGFDRS